MRVLIYGIHVLNLMKTGRYKPKNVTLSSKLMYSFELYFEIQKLY